MNRFKKISLDHNKNGEHMEILTITLRTIFFYFFVVFAYRLMGKREVGQLGVVDLIVSIMMAELVVISIENFEQPIIYAIIPIIILILLEISLAFLSIKSRSFRAIFGGKPSLIICNGKINYHEMVKQRYSTDDLLLHLRQKEIKNIEDVEYAFLESNGKLSIFKYNIFKIKSNYPMPLIVDGQIQEKALKYLKKNKTWLLNKINKKSLKTEDIFYAFYKKHSIYLIKKSDLI